MAGPIKALHETLCDLVSSKKMAIRGIGANKKGKIVFYLFDNDSCAVKGMIEHNYHENQMELYDNFSRCLLVGRGHPNPTAEVSSSVYLPTRVGLMQIANVDQSKFCLYMANNTGAEINFRDCSSEEKSYNLAVLNSEDNSHLIFVSRYFSLVNVQYQFCRCPLIRVLSIFLAVQLLQNKSYSCIDGLPYQILSEVGPQTPFPLAFDTLATINRYILMVAVQTKDHGGSKYLYLITNQHQTKNVVLVCRIVNLEASPSMYIEDQYGREGFRCEWVQGEHNSQVIITASQTEQHIGTVETSNLDGLITGTSITDGHCFQLLPFRTGHRIQNNSGEVVSSHCKISSYFQLRFTMDQYVPLYHRLVILIMSWLNFSAPYKIMKEKVPLIKMHKYSPL